MPSPLAHSAFGYLISRFLPLKNFNLYPTKKWEIKYFYPIFIAAAADFDFIPQLMTGNDYHRGLTHSLIFTLGVSLIMGVISCSRWKSSFKAGFGLTFVLYGSHLVLDFVSAGRGIKFFAPFTEQFFHSPFVLFPGVHYSRGFFHYTHLFPIGYELIVCTLLFVGVEQWKKYRTRRIS